jgi:hypothetical protein
MLPALKSFAGRNGAPPGLECGVALQNTCLAAKVSAMEGPVLAVEARSGLRFGRGRGLRGENRRKRWHRAKHLQAINEAPQGDRSPPARHPGFYAPGGR